MTTFHPFLRLFSFWAVLLFLVQSCASYQAHLDGPALPAQPPSTDSLVYSLYLVGDLGYNPPLGRQTIAQMTTLAQETETASDLVVLGDLNVPGGLPKKEAPSREESEAILTELGKTLNQFPGKIFISPGDQEFGSKPSVRNLSRLEKYLKKQVDDLEFMPDDACSGPDDEALTDDIALIGINTAWYLSNWNQDPDINADCELRDRESFLLAFGDEIRGNREKTIIVAMHHPLQSSGNRAGNFTLGQHLFPLRDLLPGAYLPLPGVGSLIRYIQKVAGGKQDLSGIQYKEMIRGLVAQIEGIEHVIFVSGHEHILQYLQEDETYFQIISGSGSVAGPSRRTNETDYNEGKRGFSRLEFYEGGSLYIAFYTISETTGKASLRFRRRMLDNRLLPPVPDLQPIAPVEEKEASVLATVYGTEQPERSKFFLRMLGEHYRSIYYEPIKAPVVQLDTLYGGIMPYRRGGGQTTQSLHLADPNDRRYQMRSVRKNPVQLLPYPFETSFAADVVREQFTAIHPYGALTVPPMERALGLYGAEPLLGYVPKQDRLGKYNNGYGNELYLIEARPDEDWRELGYFANSKEIIGNDDARKEITSDWKKRANQRTFLRARLLDAVIGDWDRHRDQWRWAATEQEDGKILYEPIARDRDQVFSHFDGTLLGLIRWLVPAARKLKAFTNKLDDPYWRGTNGKWNDRFFLTELSWEDWETEISRIEQTLTDSLIRASLERLPVASQRVSIEHFQIDTKLIARRNQLRSYAREFYEILAKEVNIVATDDADYFIIQRHPDHSLTVQLYDKSSQGEADELYYERTFYPKETKEVRLFGLAGDDVFEQVGEGRSGILVRIIGGPDDDRFDQQGGRGPSKLYDGPEGMELTNKGPGTSLHFTHIRNYNQYNFLEFRQEFRAVTPVFGFNPDDGLFLGAGLKWQKQGYKHDTYGQQHLIQGSISVTNGAIQLGYDGEYNDLFGYRHDLILSGYYRSPQFIVNFFGLGNDTEDNAEDLDFNRVRQQRITANPAFRLRVGNRARFTLGPIYESISIDSTAGRFIASPENPLPDRIFERQHFGGYQFGFSINTLANPLLPDRGLAIEAFGGQQWNLSTANRSFYRLGGSFSYYYAFGNRLIGIATRVGAEHVDGDFEFYQAARLGGRTNLRGVRSERFLGNTVFYHNTDLRLRAFRFGNGFIPTTGGFVFGFDYGRVWLDGEDSNTWHTSWGGGIWVAPFNIAVISAVYYRSPSDQRFILKAGFPF